MNWILLPIEVVALVVQEQDNKLWMCTYWTDSGTDVILVVAKNRDEAEYKMNTIFTQEKLAVYGFSIKLLDYIDGYNILLIPVKN